MKGFKKKSLALLCAVIMSVVGLGGLVGCGSDPISNESTRLVLSTLELDGVFNPFYSSSAPDSNMVAMTQLGMVSTDKLGDIVYGEDEACLVLDMEQTVAPDNSSTTYKFVLKNDVKFSNGSPVTMKDVFFNLYEYLDPMYYGAATLYSTDIKGLKSYRTQQPSDEGGQSFEETYLGLGLDRFNRLYDTVEEILDEAKNANEILTDDDMKQRLQARADIYGDSEDNLYATLVSDYEQAKLRLKEAMEQTWTYSVGTAQDIKYKDSNGKDVHLNTDAEAFLFNWGEPFIYWDTKKKEFEYSLGKEAGSWSKEKLFDVLTANYVPSEMTTALSIIYENLVSDFTAYEKEKYFAGLDPAKKITHIEGIKFINRKSSVTVNNNEYGVPTYNADGSVASGNEVLQIEINDVDPKAIYNFSFSVAPRYYYSNDAQIKAFDFETNHFGVEYGSRTFQDKVIKDPEKIGVPVGAGPYKATTSTGNSNNVTSSTFKSHNVVYFERNDNFMFPAKIKYVNYQVVSTQQMLTSLFAGDIHYVEPGAKPEYIEQVNKKEGFSSTNVMSNGYGYIGINASKVPNVSVRRAIMHAINTQMMVDYYKEPFASVITRPMTRASWAYPKDADNAAAKRDPIVYNGETVKDNGQRYQYDPSGKTSLDLVKAAGYTPGAKTNSEGVNILQKTVQGKTEELKFTFTIAGEDSDHPAFNALFNAAQILNKIGFDVEVKNDINALKKLNNGDLAVWAAAWSSTIDPDMYQVYHKDSTAGAVKNWGYNYILDRNKRNTYAYEYERVMELSKLIDAGRKTLEREGADGRKAIYAEALDIVMDLAVELPGYQRSDLFAYNSNIIDESTLTPEKELTPYNSPLAKIWLVSLKETK